MTQSPEEKAKEILDSTMSYDLQIQEIAKALHQTRREAIDECIEVVEFRREVCEGYLDYDGERELKTVIEQLKLLVKE